MSQQFSDEDLGRRIVGVIKRQSLTATGWFPAARLLGWWSQAGYGEGFQRGLKYAQDADWIEGHAQLPHLRLSDQGRTI